MGQGFQLVASWLQRAQLQRPRLLLLLLPLCFLLPLLLPWPLTLLLLLLLLCPRLLLLLLWCPWLLLLLGRLGPGLLLLLLLCSLLLQVLLLLLCRPLTPRLLLLLQRKLLWLALWLPAAALQQLLPVGSSIHSAAPHHDSCMQQLPPKDPERPRQALVSGPAVCGHPRCVCLQGRRQAPAQGVSRVVHCWGIDMLHGLLLPPRCLL